MDQEKTDKLFIWLTNCSLNLNNLKYEPCFGPHQNGHLGEVERKQVHTIKELMSTNLSTSLKQRFISAKEGTIIKVGHLSRNKDIYVKRLSTEDCAAYYSILHLENERVIIKDKINSLIPKELKVGLNNIEKDIKNIKDKFNKNILK